MDRTHIYVRVLLPLKQGLRLMFFGIVFVFTMCQSATSIKTRIKTCNLIISCFPRSGQSATSIKTRIKTLFVNNVNNSRFESQSATSIKTRIKTSK